MFVNTTDGMKLAAVFGGSLRLDDYCGKEDEQFANVLIKNRKDKNSPYIWILNNIEPKI